MSCQARVSLHSCNPILNYIQQVLTGFESLERMSWGHIDGVRAENGPPGVGIKSEPAEQ